MSKLLEVIDMSISFKMYEKGFRQSYTQVINNLCIKVSRGEILAIVGSSGSGKSLLAHGILGLLPNNATMTGKILYEGKELTKKRIEELRGKKIALVPQSVTYLDPLMRIAKQVRGNVKNEERIRKQKESFRRYDLCENSEKLFPYQLSGGMARRALICTAEQEDVDLIIADEPTPGLDIELAMKTLRYFRELADKGKGVLLITHDIDLALNVADNIAVFYAGTTVEITPVSDFLKGEEGLRHPYTKALFNAMPQNGFKAVKGYQPYSKDLPKGCLYSPRCTIAKEECSKSKIPMRQLRGGMVRCIYAT